ncbi:uncharacterized protein CMU_006560 [Cryptosporidium muris RN66]|uniref:PDZ GRASP-type domain-containing protein n=1 Tax=Cryptosporidium muris (strain RN66) TaxID=441375 RepID=B6AHN8_CRYMR|nr:uncharacterized protein CMU_006560 [Cryptosporidium muris RN66]EEA07733.1 hypothetical protein, conserved [Cryptosporidium muris RN66]|eukprot:XP_002142082.1 hypothetical protein [Cryptosporidium muris RN66]
MGSSNSRSFGGFRICNINKVGIGQIIGLELYFDYIVGINRIPLIDYSDASHDYFIRRLHALGKVPIELNVYNVLSAQVRTILISPNNGNCEDDKLDTVEVPPTTLAPLIENTCMHVKKFEFLQDTKDKTNSLGISVHWEEVICRGIRVLDVHESSPASISGLQPNCDYIVGSSDIRRPFYSIDDFLAFIKSNIHSEVHLHVYNSDIEKIRDIKVCPNSDWGGIGVLGCSVVSGFLCNIPLRKMEISNKVDLKILRSEVEYIEAYEIEGGFGYRIAEDIYNNNNNNLGVFEEKSLDELKEKEISLSNIKSKREVIEDIILEEHTSGECINSFETDNDVNIQSDNTIHLLEKNTDPRNEDIYRKFNRDIIIGVDEDGADSNYKKSNSAEFESTFLSQDLVSKQLPDILHNCEVIPSNTVSIEENSISRELESSQITRIESIELEDGKNEDSFNEAQTLYTQKTYNNLSGYSNIKQDKFINDLNSNEAIKDISKDFNNNFFINSNISNKLDMITNSLNPKFLEDISANTDIENNHIEEQDTSKTCMKVDISPDNKSFEQSPIKGAVEKSLIEDINCNIKDIPTINDAVEIVTDRVYQETPASTNLKNESIYLCNNQETEELSQKNINEHDSLDKSSSSQEDMKPKRTALQIIEKYPPQLSYIPPGYIKKNQI